MCSFKKPNFSNRHSVAELFRDFLYYYAFEFNSKTDVAQIRTHHPYNKITRDDTRLRLCVEDPFDLEHNLTSGVRPDSNFTIYFLIYSDIWFHLLAWHYIRDCLRSSLRGLEEFDQEHFPVETNKILPEVSFIL